MGSFVRFGIVVSEGALLSSVKVFVVGLVVVLGLVLDSSSPIGETYSAVLKNPAKNVLISQKAWDTCIVGYPNANIPVNEFPNDLNASELINTRACNKAVLAEINFRHYVEGYPPISLSKSYFSMPAPEQLLVVINEERTTRNLAPFVGVVSSLNEDSLLAAKRGVDPNPSSKDGSWSIYNSIWAGGYQSALLADFDWMYSDGWGGSVNNTINVDCTSSRSLGCWGHRQGILTAYPPSSGLILVAGSALVTNGSANLELPSWAAAFEQVPKSDVRINLDLPATSGPYA